MSEERELWAYANYGKRGWGFGPRSGAPLGYVDKFEDAQLIVSAVNAQNAQSEQVKHAV